MIRTAKNFSFFLSVEKNRIEFFDFFSYLELLRSACRLAVAYLSLENLILLE